MHVRDKDLEVSDGEDDVKEVVILEIPPGVGGQVPS
jgi:hypothetical protein